MQLPNPLPQTLREAVWQALVAILLATRLKDITGFFQRLRTAFSTAQTRAAQAHKIDAEAEAIQADTMLSLFREMKASMNEAAELRDQLQSKIASKASVIELQKARIAELERAHPEDVENENKSAG